MGAEQSVDVSNVDFDSRECYTLWDMATVSGCFQRLSELSGGDLIKMMSLKRMDFWTVFTDYTVIREGQWLSLPLDEFARYDVEGRGSIYSFEVLAVLALMCTGTLSEKIGFCFTLFDFGETPMASVLCSGWPVSFEAARRTHAAAATRMGAGGARGWGRQRRVQ
jgi:hypothetical protein